MERLDATYLVYSNHEQMYVRFDDLAETDTFSINYGLLAFIADKDDIKPDAEIYIKAVYGAEELSYPMRVVEDNTVETTIFNDERILFKLHWGAHLRYKSGEKVKRFAALVPLDLIRLEELCIDHKFFFVGI